jgi:glyceraldehyde 3-phosphate dehydrogenase
MAIRVAINGFGRIGRNILRASWERKGIEIVHINDLTSDDMLAYLLEHDTVHRRWKAVEAVTGGICIDGQTIPTSSERDPRKLPWRSLEVDVVLECTGVFTTGGSAGQHIEAGAKKVVISAPGTNVDGTFVMGVNDNLVDRTRHHVVSNASCTTNCLAPVAKIIHDLVGIESGMMTTIHSYTMDQNILDAPHPKGKFRRARAATENMVPTSTGAAKAIALVLPELKGKIHGMAVRVPTPDVSMIDMVVNTKRPTSVEEINEAFKTSANGALKGILAVTSKPWVSSDLIGNPHSAVVDLSLTHVNDGTLLKVIAWYDNEWAFSNRMLDLAAHLTQ